MLVGGGEYGDIVNHLAYRMNTGLLGLSNAYLCGLTPEFTELLDELLGLWKGFGWDDSVRAYLSGTLLENVKEKT